MRDIKLRGFLPDDEKGTMTYQVMPATTDYKTWLASIEQDDRYDGDFVLGKDIFIMQWTGLLDKNLKEIYEGDILATSNNHPEYDHWNKDDFGFTVVEWDSKYTCYQGSKWLWEMNGDSECVYGIRFIEIVGNIYEHPHLLEETT